MDSTAVGIPALQFDPDRYPHATLKAFNDFIEQFKFHYNAQYPEPSKSAIDNAILKWKASNDREIAEKDTEIIRNEWISKDKVRKLLGFFSSLHLQQDWKVAESNPDILKNAEWDYFIDRMRQYYKPTENQIIRNFEFRQILQLPNKTFSAFCNRVEAAGKTCTFCNCKKNCSAEEFARRDQIVIGITNEVIREKAMLKNWNLKDLHQNGMKYESAAAGEEKISGGAINKISPYKLSNLKKKK